MSHSQAGPPQHSIYMNKIWLWHYTRGTPGVPLSQWGSSGRWDGSEWVFSEVTLEGNTTKIVDWSHMPKTVKCILYETQFTRAKNRWFYPRNAVPLIPLHFNLAHNTCHLCWLNRINSLCGTLPKNRMRKWYFKQYAMITDTHNWHGSSRLNPSGKALFSLYQHLNDVKRLHNTNSISTICCCLIISAKRFNNITPIFL